MTNSLFITGAGGFIGSRLLQWLELGKYRRVYALSRKKSPIIARMSQYENFQWIEASLLEPVVYEQALKECDMVIHLAAVTGKARPGKYFRSNVYGTELLVQACQQAKVRNFLYVSTIAVQYQDKSQYYYAQSKLLAEEIVRRSGLNYVIVRPTVVIGPSSGIWKNLSRLARLPVPVLFGDGSVNIQPIDGDDLAVCLLKILERKENASFEGQCLDLGGPEAISLEEFIKRIHRLYHQKNPFIFHIPLKGMIAVFSVLEKYFYTILPFTVGQLSFFRNNSTTQMNPFLAEHLGWMKTVDQMLEKVYQEERAQWLEEQSARECKIFCRYLIGCEPSEYILEKYREGLEKKRLSDRSSMDCFDRLLLRIAKISPVFLRLADGYSRFFLKRSLLRKKLILLLAILESTAPTHEYLDAVDNHSKPALYIKVFEKGVGFLFGFLLALILLLPLHAAFALFFQMERQSTRNG